MRQVRESLALPTPAGPQGVPLWANNATQELAALTQEFGYRLNRVAPLDGSEAFTGEATFEAGLTLPDNVALTFGDAADVSLSFDGTDFNIGGTVDLNLTNFTAINAGTVDADFDALTATSYGGITEANLVDKSAAEDISGTWDFVTLRVQDSTGTDFATLSHDGTDFKALTSTSSNAMRLGFSSHAEGKTAILSGTAGTSDTASQFRVHSFISLADDAIGTIDLKRRIGFIFITLNGSSAHATIRHFANTATASIHDGAKVSWGSGLNPDVDGNSNYWLTASGATLNIKNRAGSLLLYSVYVMAG